MTFTAVALTGVIWALTLKAKTTSVTKLRFVPVIVTSVPTVAAGGAMAVGLGGWSTTRSVALIAVPSTVVTKILPVTAPPGTVNWIVVDVFASTDANGIVNVPTFTTVRPLATWRLLPVIVTTVLLPTGTLDGLKPVIFG